MDGTTKANILVSVIAACAPIIIALIGIIPTIINNRKKTEESIENMRKKTEESMDILKSDMKACQSGLLDDIKKSNGELRAELRADSAETNAKVDRIEKRLLDHVAEGEQDQVKTTRYRILRFYDEVCEGREHSESHFEDIIDDIDEYEQYCELHPDFKNNRCKVASKTISDVYAKVKAKGGFLTHKESE